MGKAVILCLTILSFPFFVVHTLFFSSTQSLVYSSKMQIQNIVIDYVQIYCRELVAIVFGICLLYGARNSSLNILPFVKRQEQYKNLSIGSWAVTLTYLLTPKSALASQNI
jgi:hypothetical protein